MRILVVDDDSLAGQMTGAVLEEAGYDVVLAEDAIAAVQMLNTDPAIGLVVSDMNMPMVSGIDLFCELRTQGVNIPFILLTGDEPAILLAREPRLNACLAKDCALEEYLPQIVAGVLARQTGEGENGG